MDFLTLVCLQSYQVAAVSVGPFLLRCWESGFIHHTRWVSIPHPWGRCNKAAGRVSSQEMIRDPSPGGEWDPGRSPKLLETCAHQCHTQTHTHQHLENFSARHIYFYGKVLPAPVRSQEHTQRGRAGVFIPNSSCFCVLSPSGWSLPHSLSWPSWLVFEIEYGQLGGKEEAVRYQLGGKGCLQSERLASYRLSRETSVPYRLSRKGCVKNKTDQGSFEELTVSDTNNHNGW